MVHPDNWSHCPWASNPADLPSRGLTPLVLSVSQAWRQGPEWLRLGLAPGSSNLEQENMPGECVKELRDIQSQSMVVVGPKELGIEAVIDFQNYRTFSRLIGVTAIIIRDVLLLQNMWRKKKELSFHVLDIVREGQEAQLLWARSAQRTLTELKTMTKQFGLFKDPEEICTVAGNYQMPRSFTHPNVQFCSKLNSTHCETSPCLSY